MKHINRLPLHTLAAALVLTLGAASQASETDSVERAIKVAEHHIKDQYPTQPCLEESLGLEAQGFYHEAPPCKDASSMGTAAFAVHSSDTLWRVFFRKKITIDTDKCETFQVVEVSNKAATPRATVLLKDFEVCLPNEEAMFQW
jgi:hypothetical protein